MGRRGAEGGPKKGKRVESHGGLGDLDKLVAASGMEVRKFEEPVAADAPIEEVHVPEVAPAEPQAVAADGIEDVVPIRETPRTSQAPHAAEAVELIPVAPPQRSREEIAAELARSTDAVNARPWDPAAQTALEGANQASEAYESGRGNTNYYEALGLSPNASQGEIAAALNARVREVNAKPWDPALRGRDGDDARMAQVLLNDQARAEYDKELAEAAAANAAAAAAAARHSQLHGSMRDIEDVDPDLDMDLGTDPKDREPGERVQETLEGHIVRLRRLLTRDSDSQGDLERKLELAEEFRQIGDDEGARDLIGEVETRLRDQTPAEARAALAAAVAGAEPVLPADAESAEGDPLYEEARQWVLTQQNASLSLLQRHFRIGYNRAARLAEMLEAGGVVGPMDERGKREVLPQSPAGVPESGESADVLLAEVREYLAKPRDPNASWQELQDRIVANHALHERLHALTASNASPEVIETLTSLNTDYAKTRDAWNAISNQARERMKQEPNMSDAEIASAYGIPEVLINVWRDSLPASSAAGGAHSATPEAEIEGERRESSNASTERIIPRINFLGERSRRLDELSREYGSEFEAYVHTIGNRYNRLSLPKKIAIGATLTVSGGVAAFAVTSASLPLVLTGAILGGASSAGLIFQRAAGALGMYVNLEKKLQSRHPDPKSHRMNKIKAAAGAAGWTLAMSGLSLAAGYAVKEGLNAFVEGGSERVKEATLEWLKAHWPFGDEVVAPEAPAHAPAARASEAPASAASGADAQAARLRELADNVDKLREHAAPQAPAAPAIPEISIDASKGHGYEWMMKRVWEQLQDQNLDPNKFPEGSDIRQLLEADKDTIDGLVHRIASDPNHGFFTADGKSVVFGLDSKMVLESDGQLHFVTGDTDVIKAPEGAPTMVTHGPSAPEKFEGPLNNPAETARLNNIPVAEHTSGNLVINQPAAQAAVPEVRAGSVVEDHAGVQEPAPPAIATAPAYNGPINEPHIYTNADSSQQFVQGGSPEQRLALITKYLEQNPRARVLSADPSGKYRVAWEMVKGKVTMSEPLRTTGLFGLLRGFLPPPRPESFGSIIQ